MEGFQQEKKNPLDLSCASIRRRGHRKEFGKRGGDAWKRMERIFKQAYQQNISAVTVFLLESERTMQFQTAC